MKARENPFTTDRILKLRYRLRGTTWEELIERLAEMRYRAAIVGPEGSGKTTLLEDVGPTLRARGFTVKHLRLDRTTRTFPRGFLSRFFADVSPRDVILFDGADLMGGLTWRWFNRRTKKAGGLVITSHRAARLPTLIECSTTPALLDEIVAELLGGESAALRQVTRTLFDKHQGNLRDALRELYDIFAAADAPLDRALPEV
jgi:hypothetical protein